MARFRAFSSDTSEDEDAVEDLKHVESEEEEEDFHSESESASEQLEEREENEEEGDDDDQVDQEEEESEDEYDSSPLAKKQPARNALVEDEDGEIHYSRDLALNRQSKSPSASRVPPWAHHVDPQKMHVMQASLFRVPEESAALRALNKQTTSRLGVPTPSLNRKHSRDSDGDWRMDAREVRAAFVLIITKRSANSYA
jgi:nuclear pore complex protein Nup98-Nup96